MKTAIAMVAFSGDLSKNLTAIASAGFDGVELFERDLIAFNGSPKRLGETVREHGLQVDLLQSIRDFGGLPAHLRSLAFNKIERKFDLMEALGTDLLLVSSCTHEDSMGGVDRLAEDFHELGERAAARGFRVGYEAMSWARYINDYRDAWEVVRRADHPSIGVVLDSIHVLGKRTSPDSIRGIPGDRIFHVQVADAPMIEMDLAYWSRHFRTMPGEGDLPLVEFMSAVMATGYSGPISLEILNERFHNGQPRAIASDGYRSLRYLMDQVQSAQPEMQINLEPLPPKSKVDGVEFVEFAAADKASNGLEARLMRLGFTPIAQHVKKQVVLWRQGGINILINTEPKSFAHSAYTLHGTSVCDMALLVDDARVAGKRARALGTNPFSQNRGEGELNIPAIRGVSGTVLHFLDRESELKDIWETDFRALENISGNSRGVGLTRIDHIAHVMNYGEMLTWTLFYTSIFGMTKTAMQDSVDPSGRVYSRAVQSQNGSVRLVLNGAETHRSFAGRFVADTAGSSVQHLALACDDIFVTANALANNGFELLPIPADYYRDLAARFNLKDGLITKLQAASILYDEDENGSFFQLYGLPHDDGFFFEIVQRCHGYDGYGAPNAPYRLAAQKHLPRRSGIKPTLHESK